MSIMDTYLQRTPGSAALDERAVRVLPGGDTRAIAHHAPYQLTIARSEGPYLWDVDGNRYIDLLGNYTALVHGNAYPPIVKAATAALADGTQWAARNRHAVVLAELICHRVPSVERVRFTNSGSEATLLAAEIARTVTGRRKILMARYGYHGSGAVFAVGTHGHEGPETLLADFGDAADFGRVLGEHGDDIACVIVEPVLGSAGVIVPEPGFVGAVADLAHGHGAVFVLDEVITLRLAEGGLQEVLGVTPDLTTMGKIIGGGFAVGAVGGNAEIMAVTDPGRRILPASGTFNGNPVMAAAGVVSVGDLTSAEIARMAAMAERMADGIVSGGAAVGLDVAITRIGSLLNVYLGAPPAPGPERGDGEAIALAHLAMLGHGVFAAPRGMMALSTALDDEVAAEAVAGISAALADVAAELA